MCGRYACYTPFAQLAALMRLPVTPRLPAQEPPPRYNAAPGTWITSLATDGDSVPSFTSMWWGYRPHWAQAGAPEPINATVEKVATSRYFRGAFARHRCLVPADGWYEWLPGEAGKQPYFLWSWKIARRCGWRRSSAKGPTADRPCHPHRACPGLRE